MNKITDFHINEKSNKKLKEFFQYLKEEKKLPQKKIVETAQNVTQLITEKIMFKILHELSRESLNKWTEFMKKNPDPPSQILRLNEIYEKQTGKGIERIQNEITIQVIEAMKKQMNIAEGLAKKISKLTDEEAQKAIDLIKGGKIDEADKIIN